MNFIKYFENALETTKYDIAKSLYLTVKKINTIILQKSKQGWTSSGSTVNVLVINKMTQTMYILNIGDSRAIVCNKDNTGCTTKDHKPSDPAEKIQIMRKGGWVSNDDRVNGTLSLSRALGDLDVSKVISDQPDIFVLKIKKKMRFILQASDGLFDVFENKELCTMVNKYLNLKWSNKRIVAELMRIALKVRKSQDNISIILISFQN